jgi:hypothetical protein
VAAGGSEAFDDLTVTNPIVYSNATGITANAAADQASATALTEEFNNVTTVGAAGRSVKLPTAVAGLSVTVKNSGANSLAVFPFSGDSINALAADLSVNIPVSGMVTFKAISATVWETNEVLVLNAPTTETGELIFKASANAADYAVSVTNASHGQATEHVIPDGGAATDYFVKSTAALTLVEADVLDTALAGTVVNSKAVIYDAAGKVARSSATPAAAGAASQSNSTLIAAELNYVTGANGSAGVRLPVPVANVSYEIINSVTTAGNYLNVYPSSGTQINALGNDVAFQLNPGQRALFIGRSTILHNTAAASDTISGLTASAAELNVLDEATNANNTTGKAAILGTNGAITFAGEASLDGNTANAAGVGVTTGVGGVFKTSVQKVGGIITTRVLVDLTGLNGGGTADDVIGINGAGAAHLGQITAALNGTILAGTITCLETPAGSNVDVDLWAANEATAVEDEAISGLTGEAQLINHGNWAVGSTDMLTAFPTANQYLYLTSGVATDATFTAGKFLIELLGYEA